MENCCLRQMQLVVGTEIAEERLKYPSPEEEQIPQIQKRRVVLLLLRRRLLPPPGTRVALRKLGKENAQLKVPPVDHQDDLRPML
jgi:hypothetical protein